VIDFVAVRAVVVDFLHFFCVCLGDFLVANHCISLNPSLLPVLQPLLPVL
jgi:hypothetical protein